MRLKTLKPRLSPINQYRLRYLPTEGGANASFYQSQQWRSFRDRIVSEVGRCEDVGPHSGRLIADHIVEIEDGGERLDRSNIMVRCTACHNRKTAQARSARRKGAGGANV